MKTIVLTLMALAVIGCGSSTSTPKETIKGDVPSSPTVHEKAKTPPSIPSI